jgi:hypothetical protein
MTSPTPIKPPNPGADRGIPAAVLTVAGVAVLVLVLVVPLPVASDAVLETELAVLLLEFVAADLVESADLEDFDAVPETEADPLADLELVDIDEEVL